MMYRYRKRIVFLLILFIIFASFSFSEIVYADENSDRLEHDLVSHYKGAVSLLAEMTGITRLSGKCGYLTGYELWTVGIFDSYHGCNGDYAYEYYKELIPDSVVSVTAFPGKYKGGTYTVKDICDILNEINTDGKNTYAVFCFDKGNKSSDGQEYGHSLLVYSVYDGMVYWGDIKGYRADTVEKFSDLYAERGINYHFDGAVVYGYRELVEARDGKLLYFEHAKRIVNTGDPGDGVWAYEKPSLSSEPVRRWNNGDIIDTLAAYEDPNQRLWYELADHSFIVRDTEINGTKTECCEFLESTAEYWAEDIMYSDSAEGVPRGKLTPGEGFRLLGSVYSSDSITDVIGYIYRMDGSIAMQSEPMNVTGSVTCVDIRDSNVNKTLRFRMLDAGEVYRYEVVVYTRHGSAAVIESVFGVGVEPKGY